MENYFNIDKKGGELIKKPKINSVARHPFYVFCGWLLAPFLKKNIAGNEKAHEQVGSKR